MIARQVIPLHRVRMALAVASRSLYLSPMVGWGGVPKKWACAFSVQKTVSIYS